jgi:hypothetical protein
MNRQQKARDTLRRWESRKRTRAAVARARALGDPNREFWLPLDHIVREWTLFLRDIRRIYMLQMGVHPDELETWERER